MAAKFFGEFLLEKGLITREALEQVLAIQKESRFKLGELAVSLNLLTKKDAKRINLKQQSQNKRFGDIAIELGLLNQQQVESLFINQQEKRRYLGDILVEQNLFSQQQLEQQLKAHELAQQQAFQSMQQVVEQHKLGRLILGAIEMSNNIFLRVLHQQSKFSQLMEPSQPLGQFEAACKINFGNEQRFALVSRPRLKWQKI